MSGDRRACEVCGRTFRHAVRLPHPRTCGQILCRAIDTWTPEQWAGQRRLARARAAAGVVLVRDRDADGKRVMRWVPGDPLNDLDRAALQREVA